MRVLYGILIVVTFACQGSKKKEEDRPDAVRDLLIDRAFWKSTASTPTSDTLINVHRFTITNTSHTYTYRNIEVRFDYYDSDHHKMDSDKRTVDQSVEPRAAVKIDDVRAGLTKPNVASATVTVINASVN